MTKNIEANMTMARWSASQSSTMELPPASHVPAKWAPVRRRGHAPLNKLSSAPDFAGAGRALDVHDHGADLQIYFPPRQPAGQEDDHPQHHTQDAGHHEPKTGRVNAFDDPAVGQPDRAVGLLADPVGRLDEVYAVVRDDRH